MSEGARVGRTVIGKLRLRGAALEPLSARLRLESLLSGAHLVPLGLPPSATVCIRRLRDPKPGVLPVRQPALRPPAAWDEAMVSVLEAQVARAARPALGAVPPGVDPETAEGNHSPRAVFDDAVLPRAVEVLAELALRTPPVPEG